MSKVQPCIWALVCFSATSLSSDCGSGWAQTAASGNGRPQAASAGPAGVSTPAAGGLAAGGKAGNAAGNGETVALARYATEPSVVLERLLVNHYSADGTGFQEQTIRVRVQSEAAVKSLGVLQVAYAGASQSVEVQYARVRHPDGTVTETSLDGALEVPAPITQQAPFYSDLKEKQLPVRGLRVGDTLEWSCRILQTKAEAPGQFWGAWSLERGSVVLRDTLELQLPRDKAVTVWSPEEKAAQSTEDGQQVYRWTMSQLKPTVGPEADADKAAKKKQPLTAAGELDATQGKLPDVAWTTFPNWQAVGAWYRGLEADRTEPNAEVRAKAAELTAGKTTDEAKVQALYGYVSGQIRYIGVAFGIGRYQPHRADDVLGNQYGDCKDKHTLLAALLRAAGFHPDAVLIGAGIRFNPAVPSPAAFNHLITRVTVDGQPVWLDTTAEVAPYRLLLPILRDREALVVPDEGPAKLEHTPAAEPFPAYVRWTAQGSLDSDGTTTSKIDVVLRGDEEVAMRAALRQFSAGQYDELMQGFSQGLGYAGTVSHAEVLHLEDTTQPLEVRYDYKREKPGNWANLQVPPQLAPVMLGNVDEKEPPIQAIQLGDVRTETSQSELKLPTGWTVELPEAVHQRSAYATYDETYRFDKGTLYAERRIAVLKKEVPQAEWKQYQAWTKAVDLGNDSMVQLRRSGAAAAGIKDLPAVSTSNSSSNPSSNNRSNPSSTPSDGPKSTADKDITSKRSEAGDTPTTPASSAAPESSQKQEEMLQEAVQRIQQMDLAGAKSLLDQVKSMAPVHRGLWAGYALIAFQRGESSVTLEDVRHELERYPDETRLFGLMADAQRKSGKRDDAEQTLRAWIKAAPDAEQPVLQLTAMLEEDGKPREAEEVAEAGKKQLSEEDSKSPAFALVLGKAQLATGKKAEAESTLATALKATDDPGMMNDLAYELADAGLDMPLAEQSAKTALEKMEATSQTWTLDENLQLLRNRANYLTATWDTVGWILFRSGKLREAESYVRAAWLSRASPEEGLHLGEIEQALGQKAEAMRDFQLAEAAGHADGAVKAELLRKLQQGPKPVGLDTRAELVKLRTVPLGPANGLNGVSEYKLLLAHGTVERAEPTGDKSLPGGEARLLTAKLPKELWPDGSAAKLVRTGMLNCHQAVCELVFTP